MSTEDVNVNGTKAQEYPKKGKSAKKGKGGYFLRSLSRKGKKYSPTAVQDGNKEGGMGSKTKSQKIARTKTGGLTLTHKQQALLKYPFLAIEQFCSDPGKDLIETGANSIRVEVLDMVTMAGIMKESRTQLTHNCVDRFFEWFPLFEIYLERYFYVEEDIIVKWVIEKEGTLKGKMRASTKMMLRGKIQKMFSDLMGMQDLFPRNLPPGERMGRLLTAVDEFALTMIQYLENLTAEMPELINKYFDKSACDKARLRLVKHVVDHVGTEDFLVLYTRWMTQKDLREWKTKVLFRTDFKYAAYNSWEKDMDFAHFSIVSDFAEMLKRENTEADSEQAKKEFSKNKNAAHQHMKPDDEYESDEYSDEGSAVGDHLEEKILDDGAQI